MTPADPDCPRCHGEGFVEKDECITNYGWFAMRRECPDCGPNREPEDWEEEGEWEE